MREIKFRMWCPWEKRMLADVELHNAFSFSTRNQSVRVHSVADDGQRVLMQFTGLLDRDGKEIYEGDIIPFCNWGYKNNDVMFTDAIEWDVDVVGWCTKNWHNEFEDRDDFRKSIRSSEVIGNIYENPELLETKAEAA